MITSPVPTCQPRNCQFLRLANRLVATLGLLAVCALPFGRPQTAVGTENPARITFKLVEVKIKVVAVTGTNYEGVPHIRCDKQTVSLVCRRSVAATDFSHSV